MYEVGRGPRPGNEWNIKNCNVHIGSPVLSTVPATIDVTASTIPKVGTEISFVAWMR